MKEGKNGDLVCEDCEDESAYALETECPYQADVNNKRVEAVLCDKCRHERCMDI